MGQIPSKTCGDYVATTAVWASSMLAGGTVVMTQLPAWAWATVLGVVVVATLVPELLGLDSFFGRELTRDREACSKDPLKFDMNYTVCTCSLASFLIFVVTALLGVTQLPPAFAVGFLLVLTALLTVQAARAPKIII